MRRQKLGKYRLRRRLGEGGFAQVYQAHDTVVGNDVALKIPVKSGADPQIVNEFLREVRVAARLDHPQILAVKNADMIDGVVVIAYPLGDESLASRMTRRMSVRAAIDFAGQMLAGLAHAHDHKIVHCDVKPDNMILFDTHRLCLADFGIAKVAMKTISISAAGTLEYMAPEQALGRPSTRSDVFSAGLVLYQLLAGVLPSWPFDWPPPGIQRIRKRAPEFLPLLERALQIDARKRFKDAAAMCAAFRQARSRWLRRTSVAIASATHVPSRRRDWRDVRARQFRRISQELLDLRSTCDACGQRVDERMCACPWCGAKPLSATGPSSFPHRCPRCQGGAKLDWTYCAWCYGGKIGPTSDRSYPDRRYAARCGHCRGSLIPFSRYCPWCRRKVQKRWKIGDGSHPCSRCSGPVVEQFWSHCAWCGHKLQVR